LAGIIEALAILQVIQQVQIHSWVDERLAKPESVSRDSNFVLRDQIPEELN